MDNEKILLLKSKDLLIKIDLDDIYYFTKQQNKVLAITKNKAVKVNNTLYNISNVLTKNSNFIRTHKSFIVNSRQIKSIEKYSQNIYVIKFKNVEHQAFITKSNLILFKNKSLLI